MKASLITGVLLAGASTASLVARNESSTTTPTPTSTYPPGDPPEIFPSPIEDLPEEDFECWKSYVSWTSFSTVQYYAEETDKSYTTYTAETYTNYSYSTYTPVPETTLCDDVPRVITGLETYTYTEYSTTWTVDTTWSDTWLPPHPTCTVANYGTLCSKMYKSEASIIDRISSAGYTTDYPLDDPARISTVLRPPCKTVDVLPSGPTPVTCSLYSPELKYKVLYWPVTTAPGNFCAPANVSRTTIEGTQTIPGKPNTARYNDLVMTSPTLYYILDDALMYTYAGPVSANRSSAWLPVGTPAGDITLSQDPRSTPVSSAYTTCARKCRHCYRPCYTSLKTFPLEYFNTAPSSAYRSAAASIYFSDIYQAAFSPTYTFPQDVASEAGEEQWEMCDAMALGNHKPTYIALPTDVYSEKNSKWTYSWPEQTPEPTFTQTASPGSGTGSEGPVATGGL